MNKTQAQRTLDFADNHPYDEDSSPVEDQDWCYRAARGVIEDLLDRRGIKNSLNDVDCDVRIDIVRSLSDVIREAYKQYKDITHA